MKFGKTVAIVLTSTVLLAGCTTDKKEIKNMMIRFKKLLTKKTVNSTSKKINKLEEDKQKLFKKLMTKIKIQESKQLKIL